MQIDARKDREFVIDVIDEDNRRFFGCAEMDFWSNAKLLLKEYLDFSKNGNRTIGGDFTRFFMVMTVEKQKKLYYRLYFNL